MPQPAPEDFEQLVAEALDALPDDLAAAMENVEVVVEDEPSADVRAGAGRGIEILGHYHGIPLTNRSYYNNALPDRISIYRGPITRIARTPVRIKEQVRRTVIHEIAHHFGISDARLRELGWG
jgi:predicted Zn-dependent protease with MMP-like domain